jgi:hypothetical protein
VVVMGPKAVPKAKGINGKSKPWETMVKTNIDIGDMEFSTIKFFLGFSFN